MGAITANDFVAKWRHVELKERSASQSHFNDLCRLLDVPEPVAEDKTGESFCFEKGAKTADGDGWADVWKRGYFAWEYKGRKANLDQALKQLQTYALGLENPPLLIVSDMDRVRIHTAFTGYATTTHEFSLEDLLDADKRQVLRYAFTDPEKLRPGKTRQKLTEEAAEEFAALAQRLRERGYAADQVAHFVNRLVFCMFAEDVDLLPRDLFTRVLEAAWSGRADFEQVARQLFAAMTKGGLFGADAIDWFNGGLFNDNGAFPLDREDLRLVRKAAALDWSAIDPSIFGTLFERGLDPSKRSQLGAHYTDRAKIMLIVEPVIIRPLTREWEGVRAQIAEKMKAAQARTGAARTRLRNEAQQVHVTFTERLKNFRVLDPACGSGNFLYLALLALKDIEHRANLDCEALGLPRGFPAVGPECVRGIEINEFAAELARMSVWIGEIQWMRKNGFDAARNPILKPLEHIECRDAVLAPDGSQSEWPAAEVIIGNPPFLGGKLLRSGLGSTYVDRLFAAYNDLVPAEADYVCYWLAKAWARVNDSETDRAGLVTTNSIRGGANRQALEPAADEGQIFDAWADEEWTVEGAAVRVSIVCLGEEDVKRLNGEPAERINADLTSGATNLTKATRLKENSGVAFMGVTKSGPFNIDGDTARRLLSAPLNPNGRPNSDVVRPSANGTEIVRRPTDRWILDFGPKRDFSQITLYELPFKLAQDVVYPARLASRTASNRQAWWRYERPRPEMYEAIGNRRRYLGTSMVAKHRLFVWLQNICVPENLIIAIARDDDMTFGVLHSRLHELWSLRLGTWLGVGNDPRYTPTTTFETFPFPEGLTPNIPAVQYADDLRAQAIAAAAKELSDLREAWLNPPDLVKIIPEVVPGYPDRILPKDEAAAAILKKRTLTNLYNERPAWLDHAHKKLDAAVAAAYRWPADLSDEEILERLFALNQERGAAGR